MSEMVEKVGEALRKECLAVFGSTWNNDVAWHFARAAIEAMREPTEEMRAAADADIDGDYGYGLHEVMSAWRAMIDAAIEPSSSTANPQPMAAQDQPAQTQPSGNYRR